MTKPHTYAGLNTSDEKDILILIANGIKANKDTYGVDTTLMIIINKCDEMEVIDKNSREARPVDDEHVCHLGRANAVKNIDPGQFAPGVQHAGCRQ